MKEIKKGEFNTEETLDEVIDMDELEEKMEGSKLKSFGLKAKNGFKKHKKKIVAGAIFGLGILAGVAISNRGNDDENSYSDDNIFDADYTEVTDVDDSEYDDSEETENEE